MYPRVNIPGYSTSIYTKLSHFLDQTQKNGIDLGSAPSLLRVPNIKHSRTRNFTSNYPHPIKQVHPHGNRPLNAPLPSIPRHIISTPKVHISKIRTARNEHTIKTRKQIYGTREEAYILPCSPGACTVPERCSRLLHYVCFPWVSG